MNIGTIDRINRIRELATQGEWETSYGIIINSNGDPIGQFDNSSDAELVCMLVHFWPAMREIVVAAKKGD